MRNITLCRRLTINIKISKGQKKFSFKNQKQCWCLSDDAHAQSVRWNYSLAKVFFFSFFLFFPCSMNFVSVEWRREKILVRPNHKVMRGSTEARTTHFHAKLGVRAVVKETDVHDGYTLGACLFASYFDDSSTPLAVLLLNIPKTEKICEKIVENICHLKHR